MPDNDLRQGPLANVKVLDLTRVAAGPFATMILADLGADVVKVERPKNGDDARQMGTVLDGFSGLFIGMNRGKRSIALDLRAEESREVVDDLIRWADVVIENFRFGVSERLRLDYGSVCAINQKIIYVSISGYGTQAPRPDRPAYDIIGQALSGIMHITGETDRGPSKCGAPIGDLSAGLWAALGCIAGLYHRAQTGEGQRIDTSLIGASLSFLAGYLPDRVVGGEYMRVGGRHHHLAPYQAFRAGDGRYFVLAAATEDFWKAALTVMDRTDLTEDPRFATTSARIQHRDELAEFLEAHVFPAKSAQEWVNGFERAEVPACLVQDLDDVAHSKEFRESGYVLDLEQPQIGRLPMVAVPLNFSKTPASLRRPAPRLDEHSAEIRSFVRRSLSQEGKVGS